MAVRPMMTEILEPRCLLSSVTRIGDTLRVRGNDHIANVIVVGFSAPDKDNIAVTINGVTQIVKSDDVGPLRIVGGSKDDSITIDSTQEEWDIRTFIYTLGGNDR